MDIAHTTNFVSKAHNDTLTQGLFNNAFDMDMLTGTQ